MKHDRISESLESSELWQERQEAIKNLGQSAIYLASICEEFSTAEQAGNIPSELWDLSTKAQTDHIRATGWLLDINKRIHKGGL